MYSTPSTGTSRDLVEGYRIFAIMTVAGSILAVMGYLVLPWFNKAAVFRAGAGLTFFQWYGQGQSMIPYWVAIIAFVAATAAAFTRATKWSAWAGIALAVIAIADVSWKMSAMLLVPTPLRLTPGVGYYSLMAGAALVLVGSIMRLVRAHTQ